MEHFQAQDLIVIVGKGTVFKRGGQNFELENESQSLKIV